MPEESSQPTEDAAGHVPVLSKPLLELLAPRAGQVMLDCTVGRAGHASLFTPLLAPGGRYIGLDVDPTNVAFSRKRLESAPVPVTIEHANFAQARSVLSKLELDGVDLLLADLGFSSNQMDDPEYGLSFSTDAPLDMRLNPDLPQSAADLVNRLPERELANLIYQLGEERLSRRIARKIVETRREKPIHTTTELANLVRAAYGRAAHASRIAPATRTFMALRIAVNAELEVLDALLASLPTLVRSGGRAGIISFHSLEDRRVKQAFTRFKQDGLGAIVTKKPVTADQQEENENPRSRSAKLRVFEFGTAKQ